MDVQDAKVGEGKGIEIPADNPADLRLSELLALAPVLLRAQNRQLVAEAVVTGAFKVLPELNFSGLLALDELTGRHTFTTGRKKLLPLEARVDTELLAQLPPFLLEQNEHPLVFEPSQLDEGLQQLLDCQMLYLLPVGTPNHHMGHLMIGAENSISKSDQRFLAILAELAGIALADALRFEDLKDAFEEMSLVNEMAVLLAASLNSEELFHTFITGLGDLVPIDRATLAQISSQENTYNLNFVWNAPPGLSRRGLLHDLPLAGSLLESAIERREIISGNWHAAPEQEEVTVFSEYFGSQLIIPLITKKRVIGVLTLGTRASGSYQEARLRRSLLEKLAALFAQALYNSLRYEEKQLSAEFDNATGVYNRNYFDRELPAQLHRAGLENYRLGLIMIDMDNLKAINDQYLHTTGDAALRHLANLIRNTVREADVVARYGGDEFSVILPRCTPFGLEVVAEKTWRVIRNTPLILDGGKELPLSVSIGAAIYPEDAVTARDLLQQADAALFVAKRQRDQVRIGPEAHLPFTTNYDANPNFSPDAAVELQTSEESFSTLPSQLLTDSGFYDENRTLQELNERLETTSRQLAEASTQAIRWENALWEVLRLIAQLIERREPYLAGGAEKIVRLVRLLADELKLSQPEIRGLQAAGWLANLGRITLPEALYQRTGPLSEQEWEKMRGYPETGAELASFLSTHLPPVTLPALRYQRERFDGKGYPQQLAGEKIPFPARLLGISTALVAMSQPRPFRAARDQATCRNQLEYAAGSQFETDLVVLVLKFMDQGKLDFLGFS